MTGTLARVAVADEEELTSQVPFDHRPDADDIE